MNAKGFVAERLSYLTALSVTVGIGLMIRGAENSLPSFVVRHLGDILWAMSVYFAARIALFRRPAVHAAVAALIFSVVIEFGQVIDASWLVRLRNDTPAKLILGRGFEFTDIIRYIVGIVVGFAVDIGRLQRSSAAPRGTRV